MASAKDRTQQRKHRGRARLALSLLLLTATSVTAVYAPRSDLVSTPVRLLEEQPGLWHQLDNGGSTATCELASESGGRHWLVIGCLGEADQTYSVRLQATSETPNSLRSAPPIPAFTALPTRQHADISHASPPPVNASPPAELPLVSVREFCLHVTDGELDDARQYARVRAACLGYGRRVQIFVDQQLPPQSVTDGQITELIRLVEEDVLPRVEARIGPVADVDGDGRFTMVLSPWLSRLQGGRTSIGGFVRSSDFRSTVEPPFGNRCDMLFLNSQLPDSAALRDLLAHEITHAACVSQRRLSCDRATWAEEQDWLNEALAHLSEPGWTNLDHRVAAFLEDSRQYPLVVPDYYRAGLWRNHGCRGATFLFAKWCADNYGDDWPRRLARSAQRGVSNVEQAAGQPFAELFRHWSLAVASDDFTSLDLHGTVGRHRLPGVRREIWTVTEGEHTVSLKGTCFAVLELHAATTERRTLKILGDPRATWQWSLLRIPNASRSATTATETSLGSTR